MTMAAVTTDEINGCIRTFGLYGLTISELRQLMREDGAQGDRAAQIRQAAARHVLVAKLNTASGGGAPRVEVGKAGSVLNEYTRLHMELAEMLQSGRLSQAILKDDYHALAEALERINRSRREAGLDEIIDD